MSGRGVESLLALIRALFGLSSPCVLFRSEFLFDFFGASDLIVGRSAEGMVSARAAASSSAVGGRCLDLGCSSLGSRCLEAGRSVLRFPSLSDLGEVVPLLELSESVSNALPPLERAKNACPSGFAGGAAALVEPEEEESRSESWRWILSAPGRLDGGMAVAEEEEEMPEENCLRMGRRRAPGRAGPARELLEESSVPS